MKSWMSPIMGLIRPERPELFAFELKEKKDGIFDFVYFVAYTIFIRLALSLAKIYITIKSWMSLFMGLIRLERLEFFVFELEKFLHFILFTL